ncbi:MAG: M42 family peptidase, partial [Anaerolineae bacterium]
MKKLLQELTEIPAPSGAEETLRTYLRTALEPLVDEIRVDALGNLITRKGQAGKGGKRILLAAHL